MATFLEVLFFKVIVLLLYPLPEKKASCKMIKYFNLSYFKLNS